MPRFFFDFDEGDRQIHDREGHEMETAVRASDEAIDALLEIVRNKMPEDRRQAISCHLRDETGQTVGSITLTIESRPSDAAETGLQRAVRSFETHRAALPRA